MLRETRAVISVVVGATLLGSMGVWGRALYWYEGNPMAVLTWRALIGAGAPEQGWAIPDGARRCRGAVAGRRIRNHTFNSGHQYA